MARRTRFKDQWVRLLFGASEHPLEMFIEGVVVEDGLSFYKCRLENNSQMYLAVGDVSWIQPLSKDVDIRLVIDPVAKVQSLEDFRKKRTIKGT